MIDFNQAEEQGAPSAGAIPEDSIVPMTMTIRPPKAGKEGTQHPLFCKSAKGNEYIDVEFEVQGQFQGRKIWQNFTLAGSDTAAKISMRTLRAIIESARGIAPSDSSPAATQGRMLSDFADFNGMTFLAKVGTVVEQSQKDGNYYVNNTIKRIVTPDDEEYQRGEFISDKPLPTIPAPESAPAPTTQKTTTPAAAGSWGGNNAATGSVPAQGKANGGSAPVPAWAAR